MSIPCHGVSTAYVVTAQILVVDCDGGYDADTVSFTVSRIGLPRRAAPDATPQKVGLSGPLFE